MKIFRIRLFGSLPCSAVMEVEAKDEESAKQWALEHCDKFPWSGADYERPSPSDVTEAEIVND